MTETENGDTTPLKPKKREGSRLDRGFPMGIILLIILGLVFFFQIISAWKIINLEREKVIYETDKQIFENRVKLRPELEREIEEFKVKRIELQGKINDLEKMLAKVKDTLNENKQKSDELKLDNEMHGKRLEDTRGLFIQADTARAQALKERNMRKNETNELIAMLKELQDDENALKKRLRELKDEKVAYDSSIDSLRKKEIELEVRLAIRKDELQKLQNANNALTGIISNLDNRYKEIGQSNIRFENAIKDLKDTSGTISKSAQEFEQTQSVSKTKLESAIKDLENTSSDISNSAQDFTQSQSEANAKFKEAVDNLKNESSELERTTTKIDLATDSLNKNVEQLFKMRGALADLSTKIIELGNSADKELKTYKEIHTKLEKLSMQITRTSESLSSDGSDLRDKLNKLMEDERNAVQELNSATGNFSNIVLQMGDSKKLFSSILKEVDSKSKELDSFKQTQEEIVNTQNTFHDLVRKIGVTSENLDKDRVDLKNTFMQIEKDSSNAKKIESLNIGTKNPNEKEQE